MTITLTLARLNYQRYDLVEIIRNHIVPKVSAESFISKYQFLNFINSLLLLRCATIDQVKSILKKDFYTSLEQEEIEYHLKNETMPLNNEEMENNNEKENGTDPGYDIYRIMNIRRKYCLIYGMLSLQSDFRIIDPDTNMPSGYIPMERFFDSDDELKSFENYVKMFDTASIKRSKDVETFKNKLIKSFESFAPSKERLMNVDIRTPYGFNIGKKLFKLIFKIIN